MAVDDGKVHTAVVLQGGGALGAYELGVLQALYEQRPGFRPVAVTGISSGAVTAAVLGGAKDDPIHALDRLWREKFAVSPPPLVWLPSPVERSLSLLGNPGLYRPNPVLFLAPWKATSIYDLEPLRKTLAELVDPEKLNVGEPWVAVGATNVGTAQIEYFDRDRPGGLTFDHVIASGSLPPGFPMIEIAGQRYWDGGVVANMPLAPAINVLEGVASGDRAAVRELIVVELFPMIAPIPRTMTEVVERLIQLQYVSRLTLDESFFARIDAFVELMQRIDEELPQDSDLREDPTYRALLAHRTIDHFSVVTSTLPPDLSNPTDFSPETIEARIVAGYTDAVAQGIGRPGAPGLRPGVTGTEQLLDER